MTKQNEAPSITEVQHIKQADMVRTMKAYLAGAETAGVNLVCSISVAFIVGVYTSEAGAKRGVEETKKYLQTELTEVNVGRQTNVYRYIALGLDLARAMMKAHNFGGIVGEILTSKDAESATQSMIAALSHAPTLKRDIDGKSVSFKLSVSPKTKGYTLDGIGVYLGTYTRSNGEAPARKAKATPAATGTATSATALTLGASAADKRETAAVSARIIEEPSLLGHLTEEGLAQSVEKSGVNRVGLLVRMVANLDNFEDVAAVQKALTERMAQLAAKEPEGGEGVKDETPLAGANTRRTRRAGAVASAATHAPA